MSQLNPVKNASSPDQIYYDITVSNFQSTVTKPPVFFFNEQRNNPFILNPRGLLPFHPTIYTGNRFITRIYSKHTTKPE